MESICISGIILTEVLQGVRNNKLINETEACLATLNFLDANYTTYLAGADICRKCRAGGITIKMTNDCLIGAVAIEYDIPILSVDRDFSFISKFTTLSQVSVNALVN